VEGAVEGVWALEVEDVVPLTHCWAGKTRGDMAGPLSFGFDCIDDRDTGAGGTDVVAVADSICSFAVDCHLDLDVGWSCNWMRMPPVSCT